MKTKDQTHEHEQDQNDENGETMRCRRAGKISPRVGKQAEPSLAAGKEQFIDQLDGNASLKSQNLEDDDKDECVENQEESENGVRIETIVGNRPEKVVGEVQRPPARKVIKRDEGLVQALSSVPASSCLAVQHEVYLV